VSTVWLLACSAGLVLITALFAVGAWAWADHRRHRADRDDHLLTPDTVELPRYRGRRRRPHTGACRPPADRLRSVLTSPAGWWPTVRRRGGDDRG
jgi:hypothetical protein